jgi:hypothetical protein
MKINGVLTADAVDDERTLAWALVEAAAPQLSAAQRNDVHVAIGVGESFGVIHYLITSAADGHITVPAELVHLTALVESPQVCSLKFLTCEQRSV